MSDARAARHRLDRMCFNVLLLVGAGLMILGIAVHLWGIWTIGLGWDVISVIILAITPVEMRDRAG